MLGPGHMNLINVYEVLLTDDHLGIAMVRRRYCTCASHHHVHQGALNGLVAQRTFPPRPHCSLSLCGRSAPAGAR